MRFEPAAVLLLAVPFFSGCFDEAPTLVQEVAADPIEYSLVVGEQSAVGTDPIIWRGVTTDWDERDVRTAQVRLPPQYWANHDGGLEISCEEDVQRQEDDWPWCYFTVETPDGIKLEPDYCWLGCVLIIENATAGTYAVNMGGENYNAVVQLEAQPKASGPPVDLLPNIVTLPPANLRIEDPDFIFLLGGTPGTQGCGPDETVEDLALRCLRFDNRIGNVGQGTFEIRLNPDQAAAGAAGLGHWLQRIWRTDGSFHDSTVGEAAFHPTHGHFHYQQMASFQLHAYDLEKRERGDPVGEGRKTGFCLGDVGLVALGLPHTKPGEYRGDHCFDPSLGLIPWALIESGESTIFSGLKPNWYDLYSWTTPDQYVEIQDVPDGVYELVSVSDIGASVVESDRNDNEASTIFRLTGDEIEILEEKTAAPKTPAP